MRIRRKKSALIGNYNVDGQFYVGKSRHIQILSWNQHTLDVTTVRVI